MEKFGGFLSYRVWSDTDVTEKCFYALERAGHKIFWDKACLQPGAPWEQGFVEGLSKSSRFLAVISEKTLEGIAEADKKQDNVLKEWEIAIDRLEQGETTFIIPLLVGEYLEVDGNSLLKKFNAFGGLPGKPWPDTYSTTNKKRTIKQTMQALFAVQGIHVDPHNIAGSLPQILQALGTAGTSGGVKDERETIEETMPNAEPAAPNIGFFLASAPMQDTNGVPLQTMIAAVINAGGQYTAGTEGDELNRELEERNEKWYVRERECEEWSRARVRARARLGAGVISTGVRVRV